MPELAWKTPRVHSYVANRLRLEIPFLHGSHLLHLVHGSLIRCACFHANRQIESYLQRG